MIVIPFVSKHNILFNTFIITGVLHILIYNQKIPYENILIISSVKQMETNIIIIYVLIYTYNVYL